MAFTSTQMGLRIWNLLTDLYDHAQLADNWAKVDYHDHSPGKGTQITTEGLADGAVTGPKLATSLDPSGAYTMWTNIFDGSAVFGAAVAASTYFFDGTTFNSAAGSTGRGVFYLDATDYLASGRVPKLRIKSSLITNAVAPGSNFTVGLYEVTAVAGGAGLNTLTVGAAVAQVPAYTAPAASLRFQASSVEFNVPASGWYVLGVVSSASTAASSQVAIRATLQVHRV